jgi:hypothetical protein
MAGKPVFRLGGKGKGMTLKNTKKTGIREKKNRKCG